MDPQERLIQAINKQTEALEKLARPYVIVDVYPRHSVNVLYFRVRNVGYTPAYNIRVRMDPPVPFRQRMSSDLNFFKQAVGALGPSEEISFFFDSAIELFERENPVLQFEVTLEYSDLDKVAYNETISINLSLECKTDSA